MANELGRVMGGEAPSAPGKPAPRKPTTPEERVRALVTPRAPGSIGDLRRFAAKRAATADGE